MPRHTLSPTGSMIELRARWVTARVDPERGGRLASLAVGDRELLVGPHDADDRSIRWGCFLMAPWAGRLAGGWLRAVEPVVRLPRNHGRNAIHGLVYARPWRVDALAEDRVALSCDLPRDDWPMGGHVRQALSLEPDRLVLEAAVEAAVKAGEPMPAALGWHPWFRRRGDVRLRVDADAVLETRAMIPTGRRLPLGGALDLRAGSSLGRRRLDHAYVGARSPVEIEWPDLQARVEFGPECGVVVVFTPANAFCVEPQTAEPNALGLPRAEAAAAGARYLGSGESLSTTMTWTWRQVTTVP